MHFTSALLLVIVVIYEYVNILQFKVIQRKLRIPEPVLIPWKLK